MTAAGIDALTLVRSRSEKKRESAPSNAISRSRVKICSR